jgi:hypothetical protein
MKRPSLMFRFAPVKRREAPQIQLFLQVVQAAEGLQLWMPNGARCRKRLIRLMSLSCPKMWTRSWASLANAQRVLALADAAAPIDDLAVEVVGPGALEKRRARNDTETVKRLLRKMAKDGHPHHKELEFCVQDGGRILCNACGSSFGHKSNVRTGHWASSSHKDAVAKARATAETAAKKAAQRQQATINQGCLRFSMCGMCWGKVSLTMRTASTSLASTSWRLCSIRLHVWPICRALHLF